MQQFWGTEPLNLWRLIQLLIVSEYNGIVGHPVVRRGGELVPGVGKDTFGVRSILSKRSSEPSGCIIVLLAAALRAMLLK